MLQRRLDKTVHGDVGLDERRPRSRINAQHIAQVADVDLVLASDRSRAVCGPVVYPKGFSALVEAADGGGDPRDGRLVSLEAHCRRAGRIFLLVE